MSLRQARFASRIKECFIRFSSVMKIEAGKNLNTSPTLNRNDPALTGRRPFLCKNNSDRFCSDERAIVGRIQRNPAGRAAAAVSREETYD